MRTKIEASIFKGLCHLKHRKASILGALSNTILAIRTSLWPYGKIFKKNCKTEPRGAFEVQGPGQAHPWEMRDVRFCASRAKENISISCSLLSALCSLLSALCSLALLLSCSLALSLSSYSNVAIYRYSSLALLLSCSLALLLSCSPALLLSCSLAL